MQHRGLPNSRHTIPYKTNSNDFGGFWNSLADSNSNFVVAKNFFLKDSNFGVFM